MKKNIWFALLLVFMLACSFTATATPAPIPTPTPTPSTGWYGQPSTWIPTAKDWTPPDGNPGAYELQSTDTAEFGVFGYDMLPPSENPNPEGKSVRVLEENGEVWIDYFGIRHRLAPDLNPAMFTNVDSDTELWLKVTLYYFGAGDYRVIQEVDLR